MMPTRCIKKINGIEGSVAKNSKKYVNLEIMNKSQKIRGKHTNIIKLYYLTLTVFTNFHLILIVK